ncbi:hypothetical protein GCM10023158_05590 [Gluconacetobacter tumulicola]
MDGTPKMGKTNSKTGAEFPPRRPAIPGPDGPALCRQNVADRSSPTVAGGEEL